MNRTENEKMKALGFRIPFSDYFDYKLTFELKLNKSIVSMFKIYLIILKIYSLLKLNCKVVPTFHKKK